jgi:hypothetical protein
MGISSSGGACAAIVLGVVLAAVHPIIAQSKDPLIGDWTLDVNKSTFAGAAPVKRTMTFTTIPDGMTETITTTTAGAANITYQLVYTAKFDGKEYPADVASSFDTVSLKRVDARSVERVGKVKGQVVQTETYRVSPDGRMLTVTQEGQNNGVPFKSAQMFERR